MFEELTGCVALGDNNGGVTLDGTPVAGGVALDGNNVGVVVGRTTVAEGVTGKVENLQAQVSHNLHNVNLKCI